ncbi:hypothetical protein EJB05_13011, partial [Eragrostis curvula]
MAMNIAAATSSRLPWILLDEDAYIGSLRNNTTAVVVGRDFLTIEASLWPAQPPLPTKLFVHCPGATYPHPSKIITTAQDLMLFRVPVAFGPPPDFIKLKDWTTSSTVPVESRLTLIPNPRDSLYDGEVGVLPRAGDGDLFTVAALVGTLAEDEYTLTLHRFDSEVGDWTMMTLCLEAPRKAFPVKIPMGALRVNHHITTTVIMLGGEAAVIKDGKPCLKLADLQIIADHFPYIDIETDSPCSVVEDWAPMVRRQWSLLCRILWCLSPSPA